MILGIFPNLGDSFQAYKKSGRDTHWENNYLRFYNKEFDRVLFFTYKKEENPFPRLLVSKANKFCLPRFIYTFVLPFFYWQDLKNCHVLRVKQIMGVWPAILAKVLLGKPILATYGYDYAYFAKQSGKIFTLPLIKLTELVGLLLADKVIVTNDQINKRVCRIINPRKVVLIPNGVDINKFKVKSQKSKVKSRVIKILSVGRLVEQKNFASLIKAVGLLKKDYKIKLTIIGWGPLEQKLLTLAKNLQVDFKLIKRKSYHEMPRVYQNADFFVLPSFYEGSPKVLLEAMACDLPCIVSNKEFARFIIKDEENGLLVKPEPQSIADALERMINNPKLAKKIAQKGKEIIVKKFNNEILVKKEIKILKKLALKHLRGGME